MDKRPLTPLVQRGSCGTTGFSDSHCSKYTTYIVCRAMWYTLAVGIGAVSSVDDMELNIYNPGLACQCSSFSDMMHVCVLLYLIPLQQEMNQNTSIMLLLATRWFVPVEF